jgi:hypothetical protein
LGKNGELEVKANDESVKDIDITTQNLYNISTGAGAFDNLGIF